MFESNEEFFKAVRDLADSLMRNGHGREADALKEGFASLNGLTDGWGLLLDAVLKVENTTADVLTDSEKEAICKIHDAVYQAVYRRKCSRKWWRIWKTG